MMQPDTIPQAPANAPGPGFLVTGFLSNLWPATHDPEKSDPNVVTSPNQCHVGVAIDRYPATMAELYEYRTAGRRPLTIGFLLIVLVAMGYSASDGAGYQLWTLWALVNVALIHHLIRYPVAGSRIDADCWTTFVDRRRRKIALRQIKRVVLRKARRGKLACTVHLTDGTSPHIATCCLPPAATLVAKLRRRGVLVDYS